MPIRILYPAAIDNTTSIPVSYDNITNDASVVPNTLRAAILAIEQTLGVNPAGVYGTVAARLGVIEAIVTPGGGGLFGGDLEENNAGTGQLVIGLYGNPISSTAPSTGDVYIWNGAMWNPGTVNSFTAAGDLSGTNTSQTVIGLYNHTLAGTTPVASAVPVWDTTSTWNGSPAYDIRQLTQDDILPGFSINSFTGGSTVEIGASVVNPAFSASYSSTPASATINNSVTGTNSLTTPFTSYTYSHTFTETSQTSLVFTLTAVSTSTKTATQDINWYPRSFGGVGTAGATSATASGNTAVLNGSAGTLSSEGLFTSPVGSSFGAFSPSAQVIYLMFPHTATAHTFIQLPGSVPFAMNAPINFNFTNQNGQVVNMDLYQSTNTLTGSFTIEVAS